MYEKYEHMRDSGLSPREVSSAGLRDGLEVGENWKMLRSVFGLDFPQVKEAWIQARGYAESLDEYQEGLIPEIEAALAEMNDLTSQRSSIENDPYC
jgi:hypothetical protein